MDAQQLEAAAKACDQASVLLDLLSQLLTEIPHECVGNHTETCVRTALEWVKAAKNREAALRKELDLLSSCPPGGTVLDPFGGSGTTGLAADRLGRNAILIDLDERNLPMARERIEREAPLFSNVQSTA